MISTPITGVFNDGYISEAYEAYLRDPASVDESWRQYFRFAESLSGTTETAREPLLPGQTDPGFLRNVAAAAKLADAIRSYGHLAVRLDPLGSSPEGTPELTPEFHGLSEEDLAGIPGLALGASGGSAADVVARLRELYSSSIGFEISHLGEASEREWLRDAIESGKLHAPLSDDDRKSILRRLTEVDGLERFLGRAYQGYKRFSIEGGDILVPMLDVAIESAAAHGAREVGLAMAHRGRINVLAHTLGKPYGTIFEEFEGKHAATNAESETGDVKYHLGARGKRKLASGREVDVILIPNPSHLEVVNPVLEGVARARQVLASSTAKRDEALVLPICVHGDAAFPGEGIVPETFNLSGLTGFRTGGTLHIIVNNQVGFTTDPIDARSTHYASDPAKGFEVPIVHVNADDAGSCVQVVRLGIEYRARFGKDFLIDVVGYRRHGHNETDEPSFTQPTLYKKIRAHPSPREVWGARLVEEGLVSADDVKQLDAEIAANLERIQSATKSGEIHPPEHRPTNEARVDTSGAGGADTGVNADHLRDLNERMLKWPDGMKVNPRLAKTLARRGEAMSDNGGIDWGHAEALAFASLLTDGKSVRMTGQDVERGTFSHRQAVLHDAESGEIYVPLAHVAEGDAHGSFEIYNSPLSETAVLGFEYGYSTVSPDTLVLWEAQFGDFVNVAQPIIDQFIAADRAKWGQDSSVVLLLPHGYEGQGPEHSSARLERFLQLCAEGNMRVGYPSTPAQYFHILRRQALMYERRPLILMQPKSLLRLPEAASRLSHLSSDTFHPVLDDPVASERRKTITRLVFCTGKIFYDLVQKQAPHVALVRVEELYPWPGDHVARIVDLYPSVEEVVWAQEEPKNSGAWTYAAPRLRVSTGNAIPLRYVGRPERASPAEGYAEAHKAEQERIVNEVNASVQQPAGAKRRSMALKT
ncbi:MAG TPA: 2-oxoglutarate dehydrogenase E1 component [Gemmatimonadaceae bacterium]|nr:2-oxoglutarate dehydrogenase E1 component [Gemmatimonadaceae bacterium]